MRTSYFHVHGVDLTFEAPSDYLHDRLLEDYGDFESATTSRGVPLSVSAGDATAATGFVERAPLTLKSDAGDTVHISDRYISIRGPSALSKKGYEKSVRPYLTTALAGILGRVAGMERFHASAVAFEGMGVMFIGQSGAGKTSISLKCVIEGADYLAHEFLFLDWVDGEIFLRAMPQALTLGEEAVTSLRLNVVSEAGVTPRDHMFGQEGHEKLRLPIRMIKKDARVRLAAPLRAVVFLQPNFDLTEPRSHRVEPGPAGAMLLQAVEPPFKFQFAPVQDFPEYSSRIYRFISGIAARFPCFYFQWCRDHDVNHAALRKLLGPLLSGRL